jgi:hypothetical protein
MSSPRSTTATYAESVDSCASFQSCSSSSGEGSDNNSSILNKGVLLDITSVFEGIKLSLYKFDIVTIANDLNVWAFNRQLNEEHVTSMYKDFLNQKYPHLMGSIKVVKGEDGSFQVIDGQHRLAMIKRYTDDGHKTPVNVFIEVYHVECVNHPIVFELFKMANKNLNVSVDDDVNMHLSEVVNALMADPQLSRGITDKNDGRVNKPKISKKDLYEALKTNIKAQDLRLPVPIIVERVKAINMLIAKKTNIELFGRRDPSQTNLNMKGKADAHNFYLNLPGRFPPEQWIKMISKQE